MTTFRIGNGYDVHRLVEGRKLILGGVDIPHDKGLDGHSDADALCHAVCDALLGAVGAGDIGHYFPDTDPQWKGISSLVLLEKVGQVVKMKQNIAKALAIGPGQVNVKATTTEKLGFPGREEGIAVDAVALVEKV
jgi:2-C-methyl-D-erythritol 2,4-cyclodiphosphate synthase